ncbi:oligosaccharide flippase family protein [Sphingomonas sp. HF-S4]|uniref:Oligosaccharide flippase family protein n=1 Tax=Sphingomonas agrestis TaxID=3080540 RepID=A0ABU3YAM7_9SPHN|nr:oligosaccharide flippase family protein [Sphingomonas sp. HF-S4]MDV3458449.1 oligosaccharide flippase family protein [Sphingomonas sp. HF-S4]
MRSFIKHPGVRNLVALIGIQGSNAFVPLLIVPYALSVIGVTAYAQVAITEAISVLALAAVLFSFDVDGVARLARLGPEAKREALGDVLSEILLARLLLFATVSPLLLMIYWLARGDGILLLALWLLVPLGQVFHSYWFYQAVEDNFAAAILTLLSRVATLAIVFTCVRGPEDAALIPLAIGGPFVLGGLLSTAHIVRQFGITLRWVGLRTVLAGLRQGKEIFAGNVAVSFYREMNVVILGIVGVSAAGISTYALIEKTIKMLQASTRPFSQLFFPKVLRALSGATEPSPVVARLIARYTLPQIAAALALIVAFPIAYALACMSFPRLVEFRALPQVETMAIIMAPAMLLGLANFMYGTAGLNTLSHRRYLFAAILVTGICNIAFCFLLSWLIGTMGAAICFLLAEALLFALVLAPYLRKHTPQPTPLGQGDLS